MNKNQRGRVLSALVGGGGRCGEFGSAECPGPVRALLGGYLEVIFNIDRYKLGKT
jgi:hypothetical protein